MYWDGAASRPSSRPWAISSPPGFGQRAEVNSAPVIVEGGDAYNCYWPMPFLKSARIEIENQSDKPLDSFYYQIDYLREVSLPPRNALLLRPVPPGISRCSRAATT